MRNRLSLMGLVLAIASVPALAASAKKTSRTPTRPAAVAAAPETPVAVVRIDGMLVPQAAVMKPLTAPEVEANAVWNLRAGLNVAALQCQYSPFLATVKTYNDVIKHHSAELAAAQATMLGHFKRYDGTRALNSFDQYTTRTYNSFSTLDAQYAFCLASSEVGRGALFVAKGGLGRYALGATPVLRSSLTPVSLSPTLRLIDVQPLPLPDLSG